MIGGYQILDLRGIDLQISASASNITDPYVLKQLLQLRDHIDKAYNFNKPLVNQLKPVLIRFRDKKNGEKTEGATFGEMSVVGNYYTFKITGRISGQFTLIINVAFHEVTNAYGNKEWLINTAKIQLADASNVLEGDIAMENDLSVGGDLTIVGNAVLPEINGEQNPSVKPIYCHPVYIKYNREFDSGVVEITCLIFNNLATAFTKQSFIDWLNNLYTVNASAKILVSGFFKQKPVCCLKYSSASNSILILADTDTASSSAYLQYEDLLLETTIFEDGVNKIN